MNFFPKSIAVAGAITIVIGLLAANIKPQEPYKNLQVLPKNITKAELEKTMNHFNEALGVSCNYCHVKNANDNFEFENDRKSEKETARKMMRMTHEINAKYFSFGNEEEVIKAVTCFTCHYGNPIPARDSASLNNRY